MVASAGDGVEVVVVVRGAAFAFEVPEDWAVEERDGVVVALEQQDSEGPPLFSPNLVLRESRLEAPRDTSLAEASQATLQALAKDLPGAFAFHIEAIPDAAGVPGERRRIWVVTSVVTELSWAPAVCVLMVQDLLVVGDCIAELTLSIPAAALDAYPIAGLLGTLRPLAASEGRRIPSTVAPARELVRDIWAGVRDDVPREDVTLQEVPPIQMLVGTGELSVNDADIVKTFFYESGGLPPHLRDLLMERGFLNADGTLTSVGQWMASLDFRQDAPSLLLATEERVPRMVAVFTHKLNSLIVVQRTEPNSGEVLIGLHVCRTDDVIRLLLHWANVRPTWVRDFTYKMSRKKFEKRVKYYRAVPTPDSLDAKVFSMLPWIHVGVRANGEPAPLYSFVTTEQGTSALVSGGGEEVKIRNSGDEPLWRTFFELVACHVLDSSR